ncbi:hypothetical protein DFH06DRAFT_1330160 [Mycena polygramma]|nr:hypothetical protein DFH06DRAFT_1330160 [Mycena polygramma]
MTLGIAKQQHALPLPLPFELISIIFIYCLPVRRRVRPHMHRAPLHLARICRYWRAVALSTRELWTSIYLELGIREGGDTDSVHNDDTTQSSLLDLWFTRAAGLPLSISLVCSSGASLPPALLSAMSAHSDRWARIELAIPMATFLEFNKISGPFPLLQTVSIKVTDLDWFPDVVVETVQNSPYLQALQLQNKSALWNFPNDFVGIPRTLTALPLCLTLQSKSPFETLVQVFECFPCLQHLIIPLRWLPEIDNLEGNTLRLALSIKSLVLLGYIDDTTELGSVDMPTLQHLEVGLSGALPPSLIAFLARSGGHLTHLTLAMEKVGDGATACLSTLPALPVLATLELFMPNDHARSSAASNYHELHRVDFLPQLGALVIKDIARPDTYEAFVALLRMRPALAHVELHLWDQNWYMRAHIPSPKQGTIVQLGALVAEGRSVRITTPNYAWPASARGEDPVGNLDHDVFAPSEMYPYQSGLPYLFSPF